MSRRDKDRDAEDLKYAVDKAVYKLLGRSDSSLVSASLKCISKGYDRKKTVSKLSSYLDERKAEKYVDKLLSIAEDSSHKHHSSHSSHSSSSRKRRDKDRDRDEKRDDDDVSRSKKSKKIDEKPPVAPPVAPPDANVSQYTANGVQPSPGQPSPGQLTADKIKEMMSNAQKMIKERKIQLNIPDAKLAPMISQPVENNAMGMDKTKKAAELQARIQAQMATAGLSLGTGIGVAPMKMIPQQEKPEDQVPGTKPTPLILDEQGRTIDVNTGEVVQLAHHTPTIKANIRAKKREEFKQVLQSQVPEEINDSKFFDHRVGEKTAVRPKRAFKFHDRGKFEDIAARLRTKAQLDKLQNEIAQAAKKTGIATMTRLLSTQPRKEVDEGEIPNVEWWDQSILQAENYDVVTGDKTFVETLQGITNYVEHPIQMKLPSSEEAPVEIKIMLTKQERKKLRRQNRQEAQKETTEKIRLGLMPPPEPKVKMANLMRVLGTEAVQDPTKIEAHVRAQMAKRQRGHEEANAARKLTPEQIKEKKAKKLKEDTTKQVHVAIYRVKDLKNPAKKFKIEANAKQLFMTGIVVLYRDCNVVVVEGGPKQQKKYKRLMLQRIKWEEDKTTKDKDGDSDSESDPNYCRLVWEGITPDRAFGEMIFKQCPTESFAREQFRKHGVGHYWNLCYSTAVLEATGEDE